MASTGTRGAFPCRLCEYRAGESSTLRIHMRIHTGERPFKCRVVGCGKTFSQSGNLKSHMLSHTGERPYSCQVVGCGYRATRRSHLKDHMRTQHPAWSRGEVGAGEVADI